MPLHQSRYSKVGISVTVQPEAQVRKAGQVRYIPRYRYGLLIQCGINA